MECFQVDCYWIGFIYFYIKYKILYFQETVIETNKILEIVIRNLHHIYKHLRWTINGPPSSYSCSEIHICWKVERETRMDPPIKTVYFLSAPAMILILMVVCQFTSSKVLIVQVSLAYCTCLGCSLKDTDERLNKFL